ANGQTNTGPAYRRYNMYTGPNARELLEPSYGYNMQWPDHQPFPAGVAILYLRGIESEYEGTSPITNPSYPGVFLDDSTPQVVGVVHAKVTMFPDVAADAANIIFLRTP
ncbi:hypothetical protein ISS30_09890, partial [bacterium]|nr:hypothetical protein [bacterium]